MSLPRIEDVTIQHSPRTCNQDDCTAVATHWLVADDGTTSCAMCGQHADDFLADCKHMVRDLTLRGMPALAADFVGWYASPIEYVGGAE